LHADIAGRAGAVLDNNLLPKMIRQVMTDDACNDVVGPARRKRDDEVHRPRRIGLRLRNPRRSRQRDSAPCQMQKLSTGKFHGVSPHVWRRAS
jgi:hypothetical protein